MPTRCHVCGRLKRKSLAVPVCGDPQTKIQVCSRRCRDEYLGGYVETRQGRTFRLLSRPGGPGVVLAVVWAVYGIVHLVGAPLQQLVAVPVLPARPGPEFYTGGLAALCVAYAVMRDVRGSRIFSAGLAAIGIVFAGLGYARTGDIAWAVEAVTVFPAALLLSLGEPGPRRALGALALFAVFPAALVVSILTGSVDVSDAERRAAAESYPGRSHADPRAGLVLTVPDGWYILRSDSRLLPHDGALLRAVRPDGGLSTLVYDRPECDPLDPAQVARVLRGLAAEDPRAGPVGDPRPLPVASHVGEGRGLFVGASAPRAQIWYVVFLPWTEGRCLELRCGGPARGEHVVRTECVEIGARALTEAGP